MTAEDPEQEALFRKASFALNKLIDTYTKRFPNRAEIDLLSLVAFNVSISETKEKEARATLEESIKRLKDETDAYIEKIG